MNSVIEKYIVKNIMNCICSRRTAQVVPAGGVGAKPTPPQNPGVRDSCSEGSSFEGAHTAAKGIALLLSYSSCPAVVIKDFLRSFVSHCLVLDDIELVAVLKHVYALPLAILLDNDRPPEPKKAWVWSGLFKKWMWERVRPAAFCRKNFYFCNSWLMCKRATATVSESFLSDCYKKHRSLLTTPLPESEDITVVKDGRVFQSSVEAACLSLLEPVTKKINDEVKSRYDEDIVRKIGKTSPSLSSCYEQGRASCGQYGRVVGPGCHVRISGRYWLEFCGMEWKPLAIVGDKLQLNCSSSCYTICDDMLEDIKKSLDPAVLARDNLLGAKILGVLEPLKVRIISKGPALQYYFCKPMQLLLHSILRKMPCFRAIGRKIGVSDVADILECGLADCLNFSIDYSSATDGLSGSLSANLLEMTLDGCPPEHMAVYRSVLGYHNMEYPKKFGIKPAVMENGQLMGSILSFIYLCLANLGVYLLVRSYDPETCMYNLDMSSKKLNFWMDHVLVNGDDMLYSAPRPFWDVQNRISAAVGLKPSVGKAYIHQKACVINSTGFVFDHSKEKPHVYAVPYLAVGLMLNIRKVHGSTEMGVCASKFSPAVVARILESCWTEEMKGAILKYILSVHDLDLRGMNLFIHQSLGGCGVPVPLGWKWKVTRDQMIYANKRLVNLKPAVRPLFGSEITVESKDDIFNPFENSMVEYLPDGCKRADFELDEAPEDVGIEVRRIPRYGRKVSLHPVSKRLLIQGGLFLQPRGY